MKRLFYHIYLPFAFLSATTINIPADYSTIQEGINASVDGDTVLVADGTYYENLIIDKDITLGSHFIINGNYSHRDATIIDGSNYDEDSGPFGSCVLFLPPANGDHIHPQSDFPSLVNSIKSGEILEMGYEKVGYTSTAVSVNSTILGI